MKCLYCKKPATIHLTDIVNQTKREMHLCEACARERNLIPDPPGDLNVPAVLHLLMNRDAVCPECGTPYAHFKAQGRLGCPHDYEAFRALLQPLVERIQNNGVRHVGKVPRRHLRRRARARRADLETQLRAAVAGEQYERAAQLRDAIRALGTDHEP